MNALNNNFDNIFSIDHLNEEWKEVSAKDSAPGIDNLTVNQFSRNSQNRIQNIHNAIINNRFKPSPLIVFNKIKKDESFRELTLPTVQDKIIARTAARYEKLKTNSILAPQSYAYRNGKGALKAVSVVENTIKNSNMTFVVRIDIKNFFDTIDHDILQNTLLSFGNEERLVKFIMAFVQNQRFDGVQLYTPKAGVPQGSPIAPILSNIYLDFFDKHLNAKQIPFVRYADDIIIFAHSADEAGNRLNFALNLLNSLKLKHSISKTRVYNLIDGFVFLGFLFTPMGKVPCSEANDRLSAKLAEGKFDDETNSEFEKRKNSIVRGWNNYYNFDKPTTNTETKDDADSSPKKEVKSITPTIESTEKTIPNDTTEQIEELIQTERINSAIRLIRNVLNDNFDFNSPKYKKLNAQLADLYDIQGLAGAADQCRRNANVDKVKNRYKQTDDLTFDTKDVELWLDLFYSQSFVYRQFVDKLGRHGYKPASKSLNAKYLKDHWLGKHTLSVPIFDKNNNVRYAVMDLDISRQQLDTLKKEELEKLKIRLLDDARGILEIAYKAGVHGIIEDSGYKGFHVWFFFYDRLPAQLAKKLLVSLNKIAGNPPEGTHREMFPASDSMKDDALNSRIKMPLGLHRLSGKYSKFLTPQGEESNKGIMLLHSNIFFNQARNIKKAIAKWNEFRDDKSKVDYKESYDIEHIFNSCPVLKAINTRAEKNKFLSHYERVVLRGVLAPLGNEGRIAIHTVLKKCDNYNKSLTDKMLVNDQTNPMGCNRIREVLGYITSQVDCNCKFRKTKGKYDSPLRHLNKKKETTKTTTKNVSHIKSKTPIKNDPIVENYINENNFIEQPVFQPTQNPIATLKKLFHLKIEILNFNFEINFNKNNR